MATIQKRDPQISVIILNYNTDEMTLNLLKSLGTDSDYEIILINNSEQNTLENTVKKRFSNVRYFFLGKNVGFAGGVSYGIERAIGEWIAILNSDTEVNENALQKLVAIAVKEQFQITAPKIFYKNGTVQNNVGNFDRILQHPISWLLARPRFIDCSSVDRNKSVDFATAACLVIHSSVFRTIGMFDAENFFMYFEDVDFSYRLYKKHISILFVPEVSIIHYEGASANQIPAMKNLRYSKGLFNYIKKHRGILVATLNNLLKLFQ